MQTQKSMRTISSAGEAARSWALRQQPRSLPPIKHFAPCERCNSTGMLVSNWQCSDTYCDCEFGIYEQTRARRLNAVQHDDLAGILGENIKKRLAAFSKLHFVNGEVPTLAALRPMPALDKIKAFGAGWDGQRSLLLMGKVGAGKTQALLALVQDLMPRLLEQRKTVRIVTVPDFLNELRSGFDVERQQAKEGYAEMLEAYRTCGLLVFDDLGAEKLTAWVKEQFYLLFDYRYRLNLPIFATSNFFFKELRERLDERVFDRIQQTFDLVVLAGPNQRREGQR